MLLLFFSALSLCGNELQELLSKAEAANPTLVAARQRIEQALQKHGELLEFFDPALFAAAGRATDYRALPLQSNYSVLGSDSFEVQAGVEVPLQPGAYVSAGGASRILYEPAGYDRLYQNLFGARIRVPLLRDRAFSMFGHKRSMAMAEYNNKLSELLNLSQHLRKDIELAYISAYESLSMYDISREASARFKDLVEVAKELSRLKTIPDYEVHSTERELQISLEDEEKARNLLDNNLLNLAILTGSDTAIELKKKANDIINFERRLNILPEFSAEKAFENRGEILQLLYQIQEVQSELALAKEQMKDELYLNAGLTIQAENTDSPFEMHRKNSKDYFAGEVTIVWSRPLDYTGTKSKQTMLRAKIGEINADLEHSKLIIKQQLKNAKMNFHSAQKRMELLYNGLQAARETLSSEQERFRLGEGASIDVLDAQKNLTVMLQRISVAAADLMRAEVEYLFATGFAEENAEEEKQEE